MVGGGACMAQTARDDAGGVGPPLNIPDILSSARLAAAADSSPLYATDLRDGTLDPAGHWEQFHAPRHLWIVRPAQVFDHIGDFHRLTGFETEIGRGADQIRTGASALVGCTEILICRGRWKE